MLLPAMLPFSESFPKHMGLFKRDMKTPPLNLAGLDRTTSRSHLQIRWNRTTRDPPLPALEFESDLSHELVLGERWDPESVQGGRRTAGRRGEFRLLNRPSL